MSGAIEWVPLLREGENAWALRCGRCGTRSGVFFATGERDKAERFQAAFERDHSICPPSGHTPENPVWIGPL